MLNKNINSQTDQISAFPWQEVMRIGLGKLRLAPKDFWALSLRELHMMIGAYQPAINVPDRQILDGLMQIYPDT